MEFFNDYTDLRSTIISKIESLSNIKVDDSNYSYVSQFVNAIAVADDNVLFYISMLLNEMSLDTALLPETIVQTAKVLGVDLMKPQPAEQTVEMHVQILIDSSNEFIFDDTFKLKSTIDSNIKFMLKTKYKVIYDSISNKSYVYNLETNDPVPSYVTYDVTNKTYSIVFNADIIQLEKQIIEFITEQDLYEYDVEKNKDFYEYNYEVSVNDVEYTLVKTLYNLGYQTFTYSEYVDLTRLYFATSFIGKKIPINSKVVISKYLTKGSKGNIIANTLKVETNVSDLKTKLEPNIIIYNADITNGKDPDTLIDYKNKIFNTFLGRNTLLSKKFDLQNVQNYITDAKYTKSILRRSISPEFTTFVDLTVNDSIINTNSITLVNMSSYTLTQNTIMYDLGANNSYDYSKTSNFIVQDSNETTGICPFELKYSKELGIVEYFFMHNVMNIPMGKSTINVATIDKITAASLNDMNSTFKQDENIINIATTLNLNTPDTSIIDDYLKFNITIEFVDASCEQTIAQYTNSNNTLTIEIDEDSGLIFVNFDVDSNLVEPMVKYYFKISIKFFDELITTQATNGQEFYTKMPITSSVKINSEKKIYDSGLSMDNAPVYQIDGSNNLTPYMLMTKGTLTFYPNKVKIHIYKTSNNVSNYDLTNITRITANVGGFSFIVEPTSATSSTLDFELNLDIDLDVDILEVNFTLTDGNVYIHYDYHKVDLSAVELSLNYDIYHIPVIRKDDFDNIIKPNVPNSPYLRLLQIWNELDDVITLGTSHNVKFIKTFGYITNIKYNSSFTYAPEYIDSIIMPLNLKVDVIISHEFNPNIDSAKVISIIKEYQNNSAQIESNVKSSALESQVVSQIDTIYSINITEPPVDIIYDLTDNILIKNYNYYTPELIRIESISLNYTTNFS